jgi:D-aminopeptidase
LGKPRASGNCRSGAANLIVCDTHLGGGNLVREQLSTDARIKYEYRMLGLENGKRRWMPQLDSNVAGLMLPGHHAKAFTDRAFLPHTSNIEWADFRINGQSVGEMGIEACYAAHWVTWKAMRPLVTRRAACSPALSRQ